MMKPTRFLLCLFLLCAGLAPLMAVLPPAFTKAGNPILYNELRDQARANLKHLDKAPKKAYQQLLAGQDDVLMAYLLAYESDASLALARPQDVLSNYREVRALLESRGTALDPKFYLSYVADQTVSDERVEAYRAALLDDGLRDILNNSPNELELYRAVSQWCVGRLKFQPTSGRDQSPLDITQKSILGRCEEMQILFVAAARTVGLPARPASTPWWPHTDNNHAWAEVWLDGAWHYTGDMDAAYYPDQTWFSGLIDKTVLILADGTLPSDQDEVLVRGKQECVINSIRNYAGERTRSLSIQTLDEQGNALPVTPVGVMVYNWSSLRPLAWIKTDAEGKFTLSVGRGAFYLSASKDGKQALQLIPSSEDARMDCRLVLKAGPLPDQDEMLAYPSNPFEWKQAPEAWNEGVRLARADWDRHEQVFKDRAKTMPDSLLADLAAASRGNFDQIEEFLNGGGWQDPEFLAFLLSDAPQYIDPKFLWQASSAQLQALQLQFQLMEHMFSHEDLASVIAPTVYYEELSVPFSLTGGYNIMYPNEFSKAGSRGETRLEKLEAAMSWLKKKYKVNAAKALKGLLPLDLAVRQKYLSPLQYRILAVYLARANGVPAEFSYTPDLIYVQFDSGQWGYYDLKKCAPEADVDDGQAFSTVNVLAADEYGFPLSGIKDNLKLCRYQDGSFYWLDQAFGQDGTGAYSISVPKGEYYLQAGYRVSDSRTAFQMKRLDLAAEDSLRLELTFREFPRNWQPAPQELLDILAEVDTVGFNVVLVGSFTQENSVRSSQKLRDLGIPYLFVDHERWEINAGRSSSQGNLRFSPRWSDAVDKDERNRLRVITLYRKKGAWQSHEGLWDRLPE